MKNKIEIKLAIEALKKIEFTDKECSIMAGEDYEESVIIGTTYGFSFLALRILEIVQAAIDKNNSTIDLDEDVIDDELFDFTNEIQNCFDEFADVWPVCAYIVKNIEELTRLKKYFSK
jgi:hypothetical protein